MVTFPFCLRNVRRLLAGVFVVIVLPAVAQQRPPAVPLILHDPYFSIWSMADRLTDKDTMHWTGTRQPIHGIIRIDGAPYRFMGPTPRDVPAMEQTGLRVTPTHTFYDFSAAGVKLTLTFFTPALPRNLDVLSRPVTYLNFTVAGQAEHDVSILLDVEPVIAVDTADQSVTWGRSRAGNLTVLNVGSRDQRVLDRAGDNLRIDWGYFHLAVPQEAGAQTVLSRDAMPSFVANGTLPASDAMDMPQMARHQAADLAAVLSFGKIGPAPVSRRLLVAYTEEFGVEYLHRRLRPYWQRNGQSAEEMLVQADRDYPDLERRASRFDAVLETDLEKAGGPAYAQLAVLAYRQTLAAHGFEADTDGSPMLFPKENFSNGCISTVDVLYPSAPFFLFFNPALLEAQLKPVMEYAALPRWKFPFAPHDLGTYPLADGQVYGGGERTEEDQMPVEESGNLLILIDAMERELGTWDFARQYWPQLEKWAQYLSEKGLDPPNQLSTDDFAGHLAHNANLSIKAIEALAAFADMARQTGKPDAASHYQQLAQGMARQWQSMAQDGDHYRLAFDKPGTWSQKYNLVWDDVLGFHLFSPDIRQTEVAFYMKHLNRFGLPLDNRKDYTKLDWTIWTATLAQRRSDWDAILAKVGAWINQGPSRVPLTDWFDTKTGSQQAFQARSVVGGVYMKMLADKELAGKWSAGREP